MFKDRSIYYLYFLFQMPDYATAGNYTIRVEGTQNGGMSGKIFENETDIFFDTKQVSMFITTNKFIYCQGQTGELYRLR